MKTSSLLPWLRGLLAVCSLLPLLAFADGSIRGTLTDSARGTPLQGASVRLQPGNREAVTDRTGQFIFSQVPAGNYSVEATYLGLEPKTATVQVADGQTARLDAALAAPGTVVLDAFTVESIREGQSRAINQQRTANTIKNIISSDAIGNLPDRTVGEALGRLPGVNVVDDRYASIRGTTAEHNSVTLDGDRFTTAGDSVDSTQTQSDTRAVDLSLIPAEMVGGIEVIKALTPDMDADSFGGTINLVTRSAFDVKERTINGKFEYILNDFRDNDGYAGTLTYMDVLNRARTLGVSATLTYRREDIARNDYELTYWDAGAIPVGVPATGTSTGTNQALAAVGDQGLRDYDTRLSFSDHERIGGTLNFDWKLSDATELHWRSFYENTQRDGGRFRTRVRDMARVDPTSTAALQRGSYVRLTNLFEDGTRSQDVLRLGVDGETKLPEGTLKYGVKYGDSTLTASRDRYIFDMASNRRVLYSFIDDRSDPVRPRITLRHIASGENGFTSNLGDRTLSSIRFHNGRDEENDLTTNLDYSFNLPVAGRSIDWKLGAKYRTKDRHSRPLIRDFTPITAPTYSAFTVVAEPRDLMEGTQPTMGPYVSLSEVIGLFRSNPAAFNAASGDEIVRLEARKYDVSEDVLAGYAMGSTKFGRLEAIGGLRWEKTETGYHWLADPAGASRGDRSYDTYHPTVIFNYRFNPQLVARLAYTNTISRPSYGDLIPYRVLADTQEESGTGGLDPADYPETNKVFLGNAGLKAQKSENFDLSLEYYIRPSGVLSMALFRKDLRDVVYRGQFKDPTVANTIFFQDRNGSKGKVEGVEFAWQQALTFLPSPFDGFGVNLNATFVKGSSVLEELVPGTSTYRPFTVDFLPEQPETVYNAQVWWEKYGFTARVAVSYVDEFVRTSGGLTSFSVNYDSTRIDASVSYRLSRNFTLYVEGKNLGEEISGWYATSVTRPEEYSFSGRTFNGGIKFRF
jgi:TonB-dependent receptor